MTDEALHEIAAHFDAPGECVSVRAYGSGHIHDTFVASFRRPERRYLLQRLNERVFPDLPAVMEVVVRVTEHLQHKLARAGVQDAARRAPSLVPGRDGRAFCIDAQGDTWRCFVFVEGARSHDVVETPAQACEAARAFGAFARLLEDLPPPPLPVTIPGYRDLERYRAALAQAAEIDALGRLADARAELDAAADRYESVRRALAESGDDALPRRIVHSDCKLNNVLLDQRSGEGLCVIDLDTVMEWALPGDFGQLVRTSCCRAAEDTRDLASMQIDLELLEAVTSGYLEGVGPGLCEAELKGLAVAGAANAFENGIRFLADHLSGDRYFRVHHDAHNLERARAQLHLASLLLDQRGEAERLVARASRRLD